MEDEICNKMSIIDPNIRKEVTTLPCEILFSEIALTKSTDMADQARTH